MKNNSATTRVIIALSIFLLVTFTVHTIVKGDYQEGLCNKIEININQPEDTPLITTADVMGWLTSQKNLVGERLDKIELGDLEESIRRMPQIKNCEMHIDLKGVLAVDIEPYLPIARVLKDAAPDYYVSKEGVFFPISSNFTARVMLLTGEYFNEKNSLTSSKSNNLRSFLNIINENPLWKAQFTQIEVKNDETLLIVPLLGNHLINFGDTSDIEAKLNRLSVFYKQIYPVKGWDNYSEVNVAFGHQIVCK